MLAALVLSSDPLEGTQLALGHGGFDAGVGVLLCSVWCVVGIVPGRWKRRGVLVVFCECVVGIALGRRKREVCSLCSV